MSQPSSSDVKEKLQESAPAKPKPVGSKRSGRGSAGRNPPPKRTAPSKQEREFGKALEAATKALYPEAYATMVKHGFQGCMNSEQDMDACMAMMRKEMEVLTKETEELREHQRRLEADMNEEEDTSEPIDLEQRLKDLRIDIDLETGLPLAPRCSSTPSTSTAEPEEPRGRPKRNPLLQNAPATYRISSPDEMPGESKRKWKKARK